MKLARAIALVERHGALLVFPIGNRPEPKSLWSVLHPRTPMRWEWDETGDGRVVQLWHVRRDLAESREVVYSKWFQGRATLFAKDVFRAMLATFVEVAEPTKTANAARSPLLSGLSPDARVLLEILEDDSPQSTKALKKSAGMQGRVMEAAYTRALKELWSRLLVVGAGEVEDGAFPSLSIGATRLLFEDLWAEAHDAHGAEDAALLVRTFADTPSFRRHMAKELEKLRGAARRN
jgi:hypothetical protein